MTMNRSILREKAKKLYKKNSKGTPKKSRMPFAQFFKQFMKAKSTDNPAEIEVPSADVEDFDFEDLVNVSEISDDDLESTNNDNKN